MTADLKHRDLHGSITTGGRMISVQTLQDGSRRVTWLSTDGNTRVTITLSPSEIEGIEQEKWESPR